MFIFIYRFVTRRSLETVHVGDYEIPEGVSIQVNALAIHADPDLWGPTDPKEFDPERYGIA
jgi:cytochrome P450